MHHFRAAARFLADHWVLVLAVVVNLAIAAPAEAVRWDNDVCADYQVDEIYACCTMCLFFCECDQSGAN